MLIGSQNRLQQSLQSDDYVDYIVLVALVVVAAFGVGIWQKLKDQKGRLVF